MGTEFIVDARVQGALLEHPEKVLPLFDKEFKTSMTESVLFLQKSVADKTPVCSGALRHSIGYDVEGSGLDLVGTVGTNLGYALPVETGAVPHFPPLGPIELWVKRVNFVDSSDKEAIKHLAFLVARAISVRGLAPHWMFRNAFIESQQKILELLGEAQARVIIGLQ